MSLDKIEARDRAAALEKAPSETERLRRELAIAAGARFEGSRAQLINLCDRAAQAIAGFQSQSEIEGLRRELEEARAELEREDRAHGVTIDQRDCAEETVSQAYFLVTGNSPEWSSMSDFHTALEEIEEAVNLLRNAARQSQSLLSTEVHRREEAESIVALAEELVGPKGMVNRGVDRGLVVVDKSDKSDPHWRLCDALKSYRARQALDTSLRGGRHDEL